MIKFYLQFVGLSRSSSLAIPSSMHARSSAFNNVDVSECIQYVANIKSILDWEFNLNEGANVPKKIKNKNKEKQIFSVVPVDIVLCNPPLSCGPTCLLYFFRFSRYSFSSSFSSLDIFSSLFSSNIDEVFSVVVVVPF